MQVSQLNHIALLVPSVTFAAKELTDQGFAPGPAEEWDGEGTREIYVGPPGAMGRLLLMEPIREGAYTRALAKRGPGVHHVAIDVLDLESFVDQIAGSGWLLHPRSLRTIKGSQTAYLARPGIPTLIEVQQREQFDSGEAFIEKLRLPLLAEGLRMMSALGLQAQLETSEEISLSIKGKTIAFATLLGR